MPRVPIVLKTSHDPSLAGEAMHDSAQYVIAANGVFLVRELPTHRSVTRVSGRLPGLEEERETLQLRVPRLPRALIEDTLAFFSEVYRYCAGEAIVVPSYHPATGEFRIAVPRQRICVYVDCYGKRWATTDLHRDTVAIPEGHVRFGTIHSHVDGHACATTRKRLEDGLQVVFGSLPQTAPTRDAWFVADGCRFALEPDSVLEPAELPNRDAPAGWMDQIEYLEEHSMICIGD